VQHLASRVEDLVSFVERVNNYRHMTGRGFSFLSIPRSCTCVGCMHRHTDWLVLGPSDTRSSVPSDTCSSDTRSSEPAKHPNAWNQWCRLRDSHPASPCR
jgi:hypothetical protein